MAGTDDQFINITRMLGNNNTSSNITNSTALDRADQRKVYFETYDVMTGVRIAATLGGFFTFVVVILLYKSRCKSTNKYETTGQPSHERIEALEEAAELLQQQKIPYTVLPSLLYDRGFAFDGAAPPIPQPSLRQPRYSIVSLTPSMLRVHNSPPVSTIPRKIRSHNPSMSSSGLEPCQLAVLHNRRRTSVDCYALRRNSRDIRPPQTSRRSSLRLDLCGPSWERVEATNEWLQQHININVIQPTPNISPCPSVRTLSRDHNKKGEALLTPNSSSYRRRNSSVATPKLSSSDITGEDLPSLGSDSVFIEDDTTPETPPKKQRRPSQVEVDQITAFTFPTDTSTKPKKRHHGCVKPGPVVNSTLLTMPMTFSLSRSCERLAHAATYGGEEGEILLSIALPTTDEYNGLDNQETPL